MWTAALERQESRIREVVSDEEDLLEDGYRGWPEEKKRTIF
jgi:RecB family endonuclease NucS